MSRLLLIAALLLPFSAIAELEFTDARIKNLPPSVPVRAGYLRIHNPGDDAITIIAARSASFAAVEFHRSLMQDGMMRMEAVPELTIDPGASLQLEPGGLHLMLMQPVEPTKIGAEINLVLEFSDGSEQQLRMTVIK